MELPRFVQADISREDQVVSLFREMNSKLGPITAIVNNAATLERQMRLEEMTADRLQRMSAANVIGSFLCSREAVKHMSTRHGGAGRCIVNISSAAARSGAPGEYIDYAASKGAIDTLTVGLAREVAEECIRVNAVRPGFIYTDITQKAASPRAWIG